MHSTPVLKADATIQSITCNKTRILIGTKNGSMFSFDFDGQLTNQTKFDEIPYKIRIASNCIYVRTLDNRLHCLNYDFSRLWDERLHRSSQNITSFYNLYLFDDIVYAGSVANEGNMVYSFDINGLRWTQEFERYPVSMSTCGDDILVGTSLYCAGLLWCIDKKGAIKWKSHLMGGVNSILPSSDLIFVGTDSTRLHCLNNDGTELWRSFFKLGAILDMSVFNDMFIISTMTQHLFGADKTGRILWSKQLRGNCEIITTVKEYFLVLTRYEENKSWKSSLELFDAKGVPHWEMKFDGAIITFPRINDFLYVGVMNSLFCYDLREFIG